MIISVDKFYSEPVRIGQRIAGEVSYPNLQAAVQMADLVERIVVTAGEDPTSPIWNATIGVLSAALATLDTQSRAVTHG